MSTETQEKKEVVRISLVEIKETLGADLLEFWDSKKVDEDGLPLRGMVYYKSKPVGVIKKGLFEKDLLEAGEAKIFAVWSEKLEKWVFTLGGGTRI